MKSPLSPFAILLVAVSFTVVAQAHSGDLRSLREEYQCQQRALRAAFEASTAALRQDHKCSLAALHEAKRLAQRACEPARSLELERLRCARKEAVESYRCGLDASQAEFRAARLRLEAWYALAASRLRTDTVLCATTATPVVPPVAMLEHPDGGVWQVWPHAAVPVYPGTSVEDAPYFEAPAIDGPVLGVPAEPLPTPADPLRDLGSSGPSHTSALLRDMLRVALADR